MKRLLQAFSLLAFLGVLGAAGWGLWELCLWFGRILGALPPNDRATLLTAALTVLGSTATVMIGRSFEKKRELEALHREKKIPFYDEFLTKLLEAFQNPDEMDQESFTTFLKAWHRRLILWGGKDVLTKYQGWMSLLKKQAGSPTAAAVFGLEDLLLAIRKELGHRDWSLAKGALVHYILRESDMFLEAAKLRPDVTLQELSALEKAGAALQEREQDG